MPQREKIMLTNLYLLKNFNNYFNRQVKYLSTFEDYLDAVTDYFELHKYNFNPNDGITTSVVAGSGTAPFNHDWQPDYVIEVDDENNIVSRWFVTESVRSMDKQYTLLLKRDSVADYFNQTKSATCFIEKGTISKTDPLIVNSEGLNLNKVKYKEYFLRDQTRVPWFVCYLKQPHAEEIEVTTIEGTKETTEKQIKDTPRPTKTIEAEYLMDNAPDLSELGDLFLPGGELTERRTFTYCPQLNDLDFTFKLNISFLGG